MPDRFSLGPWTVDPAANELRRDGETVRLEPKAVAVLVHLADRAGEVVARTDLLDAVWPDVVVTDASLTRCVSQLRRALGDHADRIETIPKVGYRLQAEPSAPDAQPYVPEIAPPSRRERLGHGLWLAALLAVSVGVAWLWPSDALAVTYRVEAEGTVEEVAVTYTDAEGATVSARPGLPFEATVPAEPGTYRLTVRARAEDATLRLLVVARRGDTEVHRTASTASAEPGAPQTLDAFAMAVLD